jgi:glycosyltransferase involved in cell wall biosynthesis
LFEGFGLVILEAMAQGTPVITTPHTAGPDILTHGRDGLLVPIRDPVAIAQHLEMLRRNPDQVAAMGEAAQKTARNWLWAGYRQGISTLARRTLGIT